MFGGLFFMNTQTLPRIWNLNEVISGNPEKCLLTPVSIGERRRYSKDRSVATVNCLCACGKVVNIVINHFVAGLAISCGCARHKLRKHLRSNREIKNMYCAMIGRCHKSTHQSYRFYGAKGVVVCELWRENYQAFFDWCMANGWKKGLQIDKDKLAPTKPGLLYSPNTCCFLSREENISLASRRRPSKKILS